MIENKQEETERGGVGAPPGTQVRVQVLGPACSLHVAFATPHSRVPLPLAQARWRGRGAPSYNPRTGHPFLLTGALLPQSSEMERRLKMGRRRPGSRLGDSEPLRLPELREPLK